MKCFEGYLQTWSMFRKYDDERRYYLGVMPTKLKIASFPRKQENFLNGMKKLCINPEDTLVSPFDPFTSVSDAINDLRCLVFRPLLYAMLSIKCFEKCLFDSTLFLARLLFCDRDTFAKEACTSPQWLVFALYSTIKTVLELMGQVCSFLLRSLLTVGAYIVKIATCSTEPELPKLPELRETLNAHTV